MIEWEISKTGARVPRWKGRLLASKIDPESEAREWLVRRTFIEKVRAVFVLGVGGGFHIREILLRSSAMVVVIEPEAEIAAAVMPALMAKFGDRVKLACVQRAAALRGEETVRSALAGSFIVLEHPASVAGAREFFADCTGHLIARDWGTLTWQWKLKGFADFDSQPRVGRGEKPLTIHDLQETELVRDSNRREKMIFKALRELVK